MDLYFCIKKIYPDILDSDFSLQDDGRGAYIKSWTYSQPQPTQAEMEAVYPRVLREQKIAEFKRKAFEELKKTDYLIVRQMEQNTLSATDFDALKAERQAIRDRSNNHELQVNKALTISDIEAVMW